MVFQKGDRVVVADKTRGTIVALNLYRVAVKYDKGGLADVPWKLVNKACTRCSTSIPDVEDTGKNVCSACLEKKRALQLKLDS